MRGGRGGARRNPWVRAGIALLAVAVAGALFIAGLGTALVVKGESAIERIQVEGLSQPGDTDDDGVVDTEEITDVLNILVVGSDSRAGLSQEQLLEIGTNDAGSDATDTIMLLQLDPNRDQVAILGFPRDLRVELCDGSTRRINAAYLAGEQTGVGGPTCLVQTIEELTGINVNHYVRVGFNGFITIIDQLGGVSFYIDQPIKDADANIDLPAGCVTLNGVNALAFARVRKIDSDYGRIARQQRLIREVVNEATSVGTLVNVPRLFGLVEAAANSVEVDEGLSLSRMKRIAFSLRSLTAEGLETRTVPGIYKRIDGQDFEVLDTAKAQALFQAFRNGSLFPDDVGTSGSRQLRPSDVPPVEVLNGVGEPGLAGQASEVLDQAGFRVAAAGNADSFDIERTKIRFAPNEETEAGLLAEALGGAELERGDAATKLTVVLGADFDFEALRSTATPPAEAPGTGAPDEAEPEPSPTFKGASPSDVQC